MTERFSDEVSCNVINLFNHKQILDPVLNIVRNPATVGPAFGQLSAEGTFPRVRIRVRFQDQSAAFDSWLTAKGKVYSNPLSFRLLARSAGAYSEVKLSVPIQNFARDFRLLL
jgi:hypothetical protein